MASDDDGTALSFYDGTGAPRVGIACGKTSSELILFRQDRKITLHLFASDTRDSTSMGLFDPTGKRRLAIGTSEQLKRPIRMPPRTSFPRRRGRANKVECRPLI